MMTSSAVAAAVPPLSTGHRAHALVWSVALLCFGLALMPDSARSSGILAPAPTWPIAAISSVSVPLDDGCPRSQVSSAAVLSAGLGSNLSSTAVVNYGAEATFGGDLRDVDGRGISKAFVCIYAGVVTDQTNELIGAAVTDSDGRWKFRLPSGPSRNLTAVYRSDQGQLTAWALLQVRAIASLRLAKETIHNKHFVHFNGRIPGPHNDRAIVLMQVQRGKGWLVFRRYVTRYGGRYAMKYLINRTFQPTRYTFRAEVAGGPGYPYLPGYSKTKDLIVLP
jgi:hypothetical protein